MSFDKIVAKSLSLTPSNRAILAQTIWQSLEDPYFIPLESSKAEIIKFWPNR